MFSLIFGVSLSLQFSHCIVTDCVLGSPRGPFPHWTGMSQKSHGKADIILPRLQPSVLNPKGKNRSATNTNTGKSNTDGTAQGTHTLTALAPQHSTARANPLLRTLSARTRQRRPAEADKRKRRFAGIKPASKECHKLPRLRMASRHVSIRSFSQPLQFTPELCGEYTHSISPGRSHVG